MPWQAQEENRRSLAIKLASSVEDTPDAKPDTPSPHDGKHKFSPLMIDMLMFISHSGHNFYKFPALSYPAQQQALRFFIDKELVVTVQDRCIGGKLTARLTQRGKELVARILNTPLES